MLSSKIKMEKKDKVTDEEFLSHFRKDDKLRPVITLVFYYGKRPWDAGRDIYDMLELNMDDQTTEVMKKYIANYHINLVDAERIDNLEKFQTDLQLILEMLKYRNQKDDLVKYIERHKDYFGELDLETYQAVKVFLNSEKQLKKIEEKDGEVIDMCKARDDLYEEGKVEGKEEGIKAFILDNLEEGIKRERIIQKLEKRFSLSREQAAVYFEKFSEGEE